MIRTQNSRDWSCFADACMDAGLPFAGIPEPTSGQYIFGYCRKQALPFINQTSKIALEDIPAIVIYKVQGLQIHCVYLPSLRDDWGCLAGREINMVIFTPLKHEK